MSNLNRLVQKSSRPVWVESEFGGSQTNILSLMSGLHVENHGRQDFIETIPVSNEHVGGHTLLFHWPWFDFERNHSSRINLRTLRKSQPEIIENYRNQDRMALQSLINHFPSMIRRLTNKDDRTNLVMSFIDEPYFTLRNNGITSKITEKMFFQLDRFVGRLMSISEKNDINLLIMGDHGFEPIKCYRQIRLDKILGREQLDRYAERYSGTSFSFVLYPKSG